MDNWNPLNIFHESVLPNIFSLIITTLIMTICGCIYYVQNKNVKPSDEPKRFTVMVDSLIMTVKQMVIETFGPKFVKVTPYFIFLISFLTFVNIFAIFGIKEATTAYSVPLTLGLITWISSIFCSIKYQKLDYLKKFFFNLKIKDKKIPIMLNPLNIIGEFTPLISITFRLWGNIFAGYVIYAIIFWMCGSLSSEFPYITIILVGGVVLMPVLMIYFSLFAGLLQAYVFTLLSLSYISLPTVQELDEDIKVVAEEIKLTAKADVSKLKKNIKNRKVNKNKGV